MANPEHLEKLNQGVEAWNQFRGSQESFGDLSEADLAERDVSGIDLRGTNLQRAKLRGAKLGGASRLCDADLRDADLCQADLIGADLTDIHCTGADLRRTNLREANLQGADLSGALGALRTEQLAGANLTGATLPEPLKKLYDGLENVKGISESARKIFLAVLAACLYCWLTIATTTDVNLITNRASSPLPIIQTPIPIVGFYVVAPLLVLCIYFYFHLYLQKLWEELGSLPAVFPDGRPLHTKVDPWLLNDLVRAHLPKLNINRPFLSYLQLWISVLLAWWVVPTTMLLFWGRYLRRHEQLGTAFHVVLLVISLVAAVCLYRLAVATLRGAERKPFAWKKTLTSRQGYQAAAFAAVAAGLFGLISLGAIQGVRSSKPIFGIQMPMSEMRWDHKEVGGRSTWVPRWMALVGYPPFANLDGTEVSQKKPNWANQKADNDKDPDSVIGAQLSGTNLRYAHAFRAFLARAELDGADLTGATLGHADLSGAGLFEAHLSGTYLGDANLSGAYLTTADLSGAYLNRAKLGGAYLTNTNLGGADLMDAHLSGAHLLFADLRGADLLRADLAYSHFWLTKNLKPAQVKLAEHWDQAFYDCQMIEALGLPLDNNVKLFEELHKDKEHPPTQDERKPEPCPSKQ